MEDLHKIALLIDADNTQLKKMEAVIREVSTHGRIVVKRAYGNWKKDILKNWEDELKRLAIKAEQQFDYISGKNATDMALVIDTLDLLHSGIYDAFVIVASDSDYTPLAIKLHESGVFVMGVGEKKTPEAFRNACDEFIFLENLGDKEKIIKDIVVEADAIDQDTKALDEIHGLLRIAYETYQDDEGYVYVSTAGAYIKRTKPDFDLRTFGSLKLTDLLAAFPKQYKMKKYEGKRMVNILAYKCL